MVANSTRQTPWVRIGDFSQRRISNAVRGIKISSEVLSPAIILRKTSGFLLDREYDS